MALRFNRPMHGGWFTWRSKEDQQRIDDEYAAWAFPYGRKQRDNLETLLKELFPKMNLPIVLVIFLTCKEMYEEAMQKNALNEYVISEMLGGQKRFKQMIKKSDMYIYIALVLADTEIDDLCEYPAADLIRAHAQELEQGNI